MVNETFKVDFNNFPTDMDVPHRMHTLVSFQAANYTIYMYEYMFKSAL